MESPHLPDLGNTELPLLPAYQFIHRICHWTSILPEIVPICMKTSLIRTESRSQDREVVQGKLVFHSQRLLISLRSSVQPIDRELPMRESCLTFQYLQCA